MEHIDFLAEYFDSIVCFKYMRVSLSASDYNAEHFLKKRSLRLIIKLRLILFWYMIKYKIFRRNFESNMSRLKKSNCKLRLRAELTKMSTATKLYYLYLILWDRLLRRCRYINYNGKKVLLYKKMENIRL